MKSSDRPNIPEIPDHIKLLKSVGRILGWSLAVFVALSVIWTVSGLPPWVFVVGMVALSVVTTAAFVKESWSWVRETRKRRELNLAPEPTGAGDTPQPRHGQQRVGRLYVGVFGSTVLAIPLIVVGASTHLSALVAVGFVLLVLWVLELAVLLPLRRRREAKDRAP